MCINLQTHFVQNLLSIGLHLLSVQASMSLRRLIAKIHVLGYGKMRGNGCFLLDYGYSGIQRVLRTLEMCLLAAQNNLAARRSVDGGDNLNQG